MDQYWRMRMLVAGFGNVLLGDDGFGVEVVRRLAATPLPAGVELLEVGTGGFDLVLKLMEGFEELIVLDAVHGGSAPGSLYVFAPAAAELAPRPGERIDPHMAEPACALRFAAAQTALPGRITIVGCEPGDCSLKLQLSPPVADAVELAVQKVKDIVLGPRSG